MIDSLLESAKQTRQLDGYQPLHAARADLIRRAGRHAEAAKAYREAMDLAEAEPERLFLERRLEEMEGNRSK